MVQFSSTWQQYLLPFKSLANKGLVGNQKGTEEKNQIQFSSDESFQLINLLTLSFSGKKLSERNFDSGWRERKKIWFLASLSSSSSFSFSTRFFLFGKYLNNREGKNRYLSAREVGVVLQQLVDLSTGPMSFWFDVDQLVDEIWDTDCFFISNLSMPWKSKLHNRLLLAQGSSS